VWIIPTVGAPRVPFNSTSYYRNKYRREAMDYLAAARSGDDPQRNVRMARLTWRSYLSYLKLGQCDADLKRRMRGQMSHKDFMEKWGVK
jgi:hypothetical protein